MTNFYQSLFVRMFLSLATIFIVFGVLSAVLFVSSSRNYEQEVSQRMHRDLAQHVVDNYLLYQNGKPNYEAAKQTFHDLMILGPNFEFYLVNKHGNIVAFSGKSEEVKLTSVRLEPFYRFLSNTKERGIIFGDDPKYLDQEKIFSVAPIIQMGQTYGYLYIIIGSQIRTSLEEKLWNSEMLQSGMWVFVGGGVLTLISLVIVLGLITRPLSRLTGQVRHIQNIGFEGNEDSHKIILDDLKLWSGDSKNDIHQLGHTLMKAMEKLQLQYQNVVTIDDLRKELLSHVSHDLRTPLASLLGYLETWEIQQDTLTPEKSEQYISTARRSAQKIAVLIEQLFELAHLDGNNVSVAIEPFPIVELVHDVRHKFAIAAERKSISLNVLSQDSSIVVRADIEKLERVFTNLIENALRHTPEGGSINIGFKRTLAGVLIQVSDTGIGIPEQDIPYVFDPHYKAQNSVRGNTAHGGLGLAITKKILDLHESIISVNSEVEKGTTFEFALPSV